VKRNFTTTVNFSYFLWLFLNRILSKNLTNNMLNLFAKKMFICCINDFH
jgi:hypothetical protein